MTTDFLANLDAAVEGQCACPCRRPITDQSPSAYFASWSCSERWHGRSGSRLTFAGIDPAAGGYAIVRADGYVRVWGSSESHDPRHGYHVVDEVAVWMAQDAELAVWMAAQQAQRQQRWVDWAGLAAEMDRGYRQFAEQIRRQMERVGADCAPLFRGMARSFRDIVDGVRRHDHVTQIRSLWPVDGPTDPRERALWLRRNRNTGPRVGTPRPRRIDPAGGVRTLPVR